MKKIIEHDLFWSLVAWFLWMFLYLIFMRVLWLETQVNKITKDTWEIHELLFDKDIIIWQEK